MNMGKSEQKKFEYLKCIYLYTSSLTYCKISRHLNYRFMCVYYIYMYGKYKRIHKKTLF
jgi:hypothetical protein